MKSIIAVLWISVLACGSRQTILHGNIKAIENGTATIIDIVSRDTLARVPIQDHLFSVSLDINIDDYSALPALILCIQHDRKKSVAAPIAIENTATSITIEEDGVAIYSGTELQNEFSEFVKKVRDLDKQLLERSTKDHIDSIQNSMGKQLDDFYYSNRSGKLKQFVSFIVTDFIHRGIVDPIDLAHIQEMCDREQLDSIELRICSSIRKYYEQWEGSQLRPFEGVLLNGSAFSIEEFIGEKPFIIDFWASWCGPCIREFPELKLIHSEGIVNLLGVSIDDHDNAWRSAVDRFNLLWPNMRDDDGRIRQLYNVTSVPTKIIVDKNGIIVARNPDNIRNILATLDN